MDTCRSGKRGVKQSVLWSSIKVKELCCNVSIEYNVLGEIIKDWQPVRGPKEEEGEEGEEGEEYVVERRRRRIAGTQFPSFALTLTSLD